MWSSGGRAGLGLSQQAKGQTRSQKGITFTSEFPLVDLILHVFVRIFLANVRCVEDGDVSFHFGITMLL